MSKNYSELIKMPEGKTLEFKQDISSPEKIIKTLTAFANTAVFDFPGTADTLRANSDLQSSEYATPVLGIIFI